MSVECNQPESGGVYLLSPPSYQPVLISKIANDQYFVPYWLPEVGKFIINPTTAVSPTGEISTLESSLPQTWLVSVSPHGDYAFDYEKNTIIALNKNVEPMNLKSRALVVTWHPNDGSLWYFSDSALFRATPPEYNSSLILDGVNVDESWKRGSLIWLH